MNVSLKLDSSVARASTVNDNDDIADGSQCVQPQKSKHIIIVSHQSVWSYSGLSWVPYKSIEGEPFVSA